MPAMIYQQTTADIPKLAVPVDLSTGDWTSPSNGIIDLNPVPTRRIYVGTAGDLVAVLAGDPTTAVTFKNHPEGHSYDLAVIKVIKVGTTATDILAIY